MRTRSTALAAAVALFAVGFALVPVRAEQIHRHQFGGRHTVLIRGDANVHVDENEHDMSTQFFHSPPSSEHIKLTAENTTGEAAFINYYYETPPAPISEVLTAGVWVKSTKSGIELRARVVFPKEPDPTNPQVPLTGLIVGKTYVAEKTRHWDKLTLENVPELLGKALPVIQTRIGRAVNTTDAYIDRLVLNLYTGPGAADVWVDDLDIGPVKTVVRPDAPATGAPGVSTRFPRSGEGQARGVQVEQRGGQIAVNGKPFFFRAIRHTGTPLYVLRQAGFNSVWLPPDASADLLEEANREGWLTIPSIPLAAAQSEDDTAVSAERDDVNPAIQRFNNTDVLFWDLGGGRTIDDAPRVSRTFNVIRQQDPRRPRGADVWDGFQTYSGYLDVIGAHRWPLFTSLDMAKYRDWLAQRRALTATRSTYWTWIQNHLPDWYITNVMEQDPNQPFIDPIGPNPEQVRVMTYIAVASGCRGLGFWSDRYLADSHHGRDRLNGMAILNAELDMLSPIVLSVGERTQWLDTNNPNVKAALLRSEKGSLLLPIWFGPGTQFVPDQGAIPALTVTVPLVQDGADPYRISPAGVECLNHQTKKVVSGTELTIMEFDLVCPIVFTSDRKELLPWWQEYNRVYGRVAAQWALDMAYVEYEKVRTVHMKLANMGVQIDGADVLFKKAAEFHDAARRQFAAELYDKAYLDATRALRPLRTIMHDHWKKATETLDTPTASPYAVSFFTLPKHWELFHAVQASRLGANVLPHGGFEFAERVPTSGVPVTGLPGWSARTGTVDRVNVRAGIFPSDKLTEKLEARKGPLPGKGPFKESRPITSPDAGYTPPQPELGKSALVLEVRHRGEVDRDGKPVEVSQAPLERTFLAVDSPAVKLAPGSLVRVSGWVRVPQEIVGSADGVLFYDDAGGEPLGVRLSVQQHWKQFHLYRKVPASGQISVTMALTGIGLAYFDDIRIEPLIPNAAPAPIAATTASTTTAARSAPKR